MIKEYALIIGSMKSGTTTLFSQISNHDAVAPAEPKEPGFFADEEVHAMGWDWYESLFGFDPAVHRYGLEGSTDYTKDPFCAGVTERLRAAEAEGRRFKLLYMMRHPVERLESHAYHTATSNREVLRRPSPRPGHDLDEGVSAVNLAASDYARQLEPFMPWFERGDLKLLTLEQYKDDAASVLEDVGAFLGLEGLTYAPEGAWANKATDRKREHAAITQLKEGVPGLIQFGKQVLPQGVRQKINQAAKYKVEVEGRFRFTDEERAHWNAVYGPQNDLLKDRFGFDPEWDFS